MIGIDLCQSIGYDDNDEGQAKAEETTVEILVYSNQQRGDVHEWEAHHSVSLTFFAPVRRPVRRAAISPTF